MLLMNGNLFKVTGFNAKFITTNGAVKNNGAAVMGRGCAAQAKKVYPNIEFTLGSSIKKHKNVVKVLLEDNGVAIGAFPVKPVSVICNYKKDNVVAHMRSQFQPGSRVPGWAAVASIDIIRESAKQITVLADEKKWDKVLIPRPGCGAGELTWEKVLPVLQHFLDDRFYSITF